MCKLFADILGDVDVEGCDSNDPRIKQLTTRHRGDPVHMGHSSHHQKLSLEQRQNAQRISQMVILGRGHEVGVYGYVNAPQPQIRAAPHPRPSPIRAQSPRPCTGHPSPIKAQSIRPSPIRARSPHSTSQSSMLTAYQGVMGPTPLTQNAQPPENPVPFAHKRVPSAEYPDPFAQESTLRKTQSAKQMPMCSMHMSGPGPALSSQIPIQRMVSCQ